MKIYDRFYGFCVDSFERVLLGIKRVVDKDSTLLIEYYTSRALAIWGAVVAMPWFDSIEAVTAREWIGKIIGDETFVGAVALVVGILQMVAIARKDAPRRRHMAACAVFVWCAICLIFIATDPRIPTGYVYLLAVIVNARAYLHLYGKIKHNGNGEGQREESESGEGQSNSVEEGGIKEVA